MQQIWYYYLPPPGLCFFIYNKKNTLTFVTTSSEQLGQRILVENGRLLAVVGNSWT